MNNVFVIGHALRLEINRRNYYPLHRYGWKVMFVVPDIITDKEFPIEYSDCPGPGTNDIQVLASKNKQPRYYLPNGLQALIEEKKPNIVIIENEVDSIIACRVGAWVHAYGGKCVCISNENVMAHILNSVLRGNFKAAARSLRSKLWAVWSRRCVDHVFVISHGGIAAMEAIGFRHQVTLMPLGFDEKIFKPYDTFTCDTVRKNMGLEKPVIAYCGRLIRNKGVHLLIDALTRLTDLEWQLLIDDFSGVRVNDEQKKYIAQLRGSIDSSGIAGRVKYFRATHHEMPNVMNAADVVVVPSIWLEQYGRVAAEAMACGKVVIASDIGALPELIGDAGFLVPPNDADALADAIRDILIDASIREAVGCMAAQRAKDFLGVEVQCRIMDGVMRRLIGASVG